MMISAIRPHVVSAANNPAPAEPAAGPPEDAPATAARPDPMAATYQHKHLELLAKLERLSNVTVKERPGPMRHVETSAERTARTLTENIR